MATFIVKCFGSISDCLYGTGEWHPPTQIPASQPIPEVILDTSTMGKTFSDSFNFLVLGNRLDGVLFVQFTALALKTTFQCSPVLFTMFTFTVA